MFTPLIRVLNRLVLETLEPLPGDRKCFRLINGVLVERTVKDVIPALQTNSEGLKKVLDDLVTQYKGKQDELEKWKVRQSLTPHLKAVTNFGNRKRTTFRLSRADLSTCAPRIARLDFGQPLCHNLISDYRTERSRVRRSFVQKLLD